MCANLKSWDECVEERARRSMSAMSAMSVLSVSTKEEVRYQACELYRSYAAAVRSRRSEVDRCRRRLKF